MNKLAALSKLAGAYHHLLGENPKQVATGWNTVGLEPADAGDRAAVYAIEMVFGYIRRSMRITDFAPKPKDVEGMNPAGPKYL